MSPGLMWRLCCSIAYTSTVVSIEDDWVLIARRSHASAQVLFNHQMPPDSVLQLAHRADEARRRTLGWRRRNKLIVGRVPLQPATAAAATDAYDAVGIRPLVSWPYRAHGRWHVERPAARGQELNSGLLT